MEKLYKIGQWLLWNKERMVFIVLLGVLCFKVYNVTAKGDENAASAERKAYMPPRSEPPPGWYESDDAPPDPPPIPPIPEETPYQGFVRRNPFTVWGDQVGENPEEQDVPEDIKLIRIQKWPDGTWKAGIQTQVLKYYEEGEAFESYRLLKIDPGTQSVEVHSDRLGKSITLTVESNE